MIEIWVESVKFNTSERLDNQARTSQKNGRFSDLEILEIRGQIYHEEYTQREPLKMNWNIKCWKPNCHKTQHHNINANKNEKI